MSFTMSPGIPVLSWGIFKEALGHRMSIQLTARPWRVFRLKGLHVCTLDRVAAAAAAAWSSDVFPLSYSVRTGYPFFSYSVFFYVLKQNVLCPVFCNIRKWIDTLVKGYQSKTAAMTRPVKASSQLRGSTCTGNHPAFSPWEESPGFEWRTIVRLGSLRQRLICIPGVFP